MKTKRAGLLTKLVVLAMLVFVASALLNLRTQIQSAQADLAQLQAEKAEQEQTNADLRDAVENSDDPQRQMEIARSKLGLVAPGDQIIEFTD
ncbi:MAG TPA: septum formation initiator family protein [Candidatus Flavonifractor merdigallinarum]|uniref:Septum formation initiator family protein n=1 Tax=Candidatus Flavonifractor merdigallinarum TaxID=2838589 RepID=A0A9D2BY30_9FIRM|nr:septum formation initiator family protein [Candidatus Flavonifractor merdigallinarum]